MLQAGDTLPEATVFLGPGRPLTLLELVEDGPKLIVFYPFDWSSTCTNEMELVRDRRADFDEVGVQPVGISRDSPWCHIAWTQVLDLNFGLLSDFNGEAVRAFGVGFEFRGFRDVAQRSAFLVDEAGTVLAAWEYPSGAVPDVDEWLAAAAQVLKPARASG
jgi:glutaredoxin-dependent peroxiredoxin